MRAFFKWLLGAAAGLIMLATQVGPQEATSRLSEWLTFLGFQGAPEWLVNQAADKWGFWIGLFIFSVLVSLSFIDWLLAWRSAHRRKGDQAISYLPEPDCDLSFAMWAMSDTSAWSKWYRAQALVTDSMPGERSYMDIVVGKVEEQALKGTLQIRGRPAESKDWEPIKREDWLSARLDIQPNTGLGSPWKVRIMPRGGIDRKLVSGLIKYDNRLLVNSAQFQSIWPRQDAEIDRARKQLLKEASRLGCDPAKIRLLNKT